MKITAKEVTEIIRSQMELGRTPGYGRHPVQTRELTARSIIRIKYSIKSSDKFGRLEFFCIELSLVIALAITQKQSYTQAEHMVGKFVVLGAEFCLDIVIAVPDYFPLLFLQFQSLEDIVIEKGEKIEISS